MNINSLIIQTEGRKRIITDDWKLKIKQTKLQIENLEIENIDNKSEYSNAFNLSRNIKKGQDYVKKIIDSLDDDEILNAKTLLIELNNVLASKNTQIKKSIEKYKTNEKNLIIETNFNNITDQLNYKADFELYKKECEIAFKGKSKFEEMNDVAEKIANNYNETIKKDEQKFNEIYEQLKIFCFSLCYDAPRDYLKQLSKDIVSYKNTFTEITKKLKQEKQNIDTIIPSKTSILTEKINNNSTDFNIDKKMWRDIYGHIKMQHFLTNESKTYAEILLESIKNFCNKNIVIKEQK